MNVLVNLDMSYGNFRNLKCNHQVMEVEGIFPDYYTLNPNKCFCKECEKNQNSHCILGLAFIHAREYTFQDKLKSILEQIENLKEIEK